MLNSFINKLSEETINKLVKTGIFNSLQRCTMFGCRTIGLEFGPVFQVGTLGIGAYLLYRGLRRPATQEQNNEPKVVNNREEFPQVNLLVLPPNRTPEGDSALKLEKTQKSKCVFI